MVDCFCLSNFDHSISGGAKVRLAPLATAMPRGFRRRAAEHFHALEHFALDDEGRWAMGLAWSYDMIRQRATNGTRAFAVHVTYFPAAPEVKR